MRNTLLRLIPLGFAAVVACGGSDGRNDERRAQARPGPEQTPLRLTGCVVTAPGSATFGLNQVHIEGDPKAAASAHTSSDSETARAPIAEGSWVRLLAPENRDLRQYVGQQVTLSGTIRDPGLNAIGTAGSRGAETPSGDRSQAADDDRHHSARVKDEAGRIGRESLANGVAPEIAVQEITPTGKQCEVK